MTAYAWINACNSYFLWRTLDNIKKKGKKSKVTEVMAKFYLSVLFWSSASIWQSIWTHIFAYILCVSLGILALSCRGPLVPYASVFLHCVMWSLLTVTCTWKDSRLLGEKKPCFKRPHVSCFSVIWSWLDLTSVVATHRNGCLCFSRGEVKRM